jgi:hypothetical protein
MHSTMTTQVHAQHAQQSKTTTKFSPENFLLARGGIAA